MASIYLTLGGNQVGEWYNYPRLRILESQAVDVHGSHRIATDPGSADVILFATNFSFDPVSLGVLATREFRRYASRCVLFDSGDYPSPVIGGLCASYPKEYLAAGLAVGWCYHHPSSAEATLHRQKWHRPRYLWSFLGSQITHPIRAHIMEMSDPEAFVEDTSGISQKNLRGDTPQSEQNRFIGKYVEILGDSAFIVCPRGRGASSMRIFEAMRGGRAPVIISDAWTPPPFVNWGHCSLRLQESEVSSLPDFLRLHQKSAQQLGECARQEWERVFGPAGLFHYSVEACLSIVRARPKNYLLQALKRCKTMARPPWRRLILRQCKAIIRDRLRQV